MWGSCSNSRFLFYIFVASVVNNPLYEVSLTGLRSLRIIETPLLGGPCNDAENTNLRICTSLSLFTTNQGNSTLMNS